MEQPHSGTSRRKPGKCRCGHKSFDHFDRAIWLCHGPLDPGEDTNPSLKPGTGWMNLCPCKNYSEFTVEDSLEFQQAVAKTMAGQMEETKRLALGAILEIWKAAKWKFPWSQTKPR